MPFHKDAMKATVNADRSIWEALDKIAAEKGYPSTRKFINAEIRRIGAQHKELPSCAGAKSKRQNIYQIPKFLERSFANLSCRISVPVSTILTCYLIVQALENAANRDEPNLS